MQTFQILTPPLQGDSFSTRLTRGLTFLALMGVAAGGIWIAAKLTPMKAPKKEER
jgi:hypothetical protein